MTSTIATDKAAEPPFIPTRAFTLTGAEDQAKLVRLFNDQLVAELQTLATAIAAADPDTISEIAHGLQGSAVTVGASLVADISAALCTLARSGSTEGAPALYAQLADAAARTSAAMLACLEPGTDQTTGR